MSTTAIAITGMRTATNIISQSANNIANSETPGFKTAFTNLSNIAGDNGVQSTEGNLISQKGAFEYTGIVTDLATKGNKGFFIVKNKLSNEVVNVVTGNFRPNVDGKLEYLDKYLLLGAKYKDDGSEPELDIKTLEPVIVDNNILSKAVATSKVSEEFNLNSGLLAKGQASFVMEPLAANQSSSKTLNGFLKEDGDLLSGNGFSVSIQEEKDGDIALQSIKCIFRGAKVSNSFLDSGTTITNPTDEINGTYNGLSFSFKVSDVLGANDGATIRNIASKLVSVGINAQVTSTGNPSSSTITIVPPSNGSDSLSISGGLATSLNIVYSVTPIQSGAIRFSSMGDLKNGLQKYFKDIKTSSSSDGLVFIARPNTNVSLDNIQSADVLGALNMYPGPVLGQGYDPYDSNSNMASGNTQPDIIQAVTLYDSKGGTHLANIALKKVEDGWIQEFFVASPNELKESRSDGLLQVTKFTFDTKGNLSGSKPVVPSVTTSLVSDPHATLPGGNFVVNGVTLTQGTDFSSMVDLAVKINSDATLSKDFQATVYEDSAGGYRLRIIPKLAAKPSVQSTSIAIAQAPDTLPSSSEPLQITFIQEENVDTITLDFDSSKMSESVHEEMIGYVTSNGMSPSSLTNISIDVDGSLIGNFANGTSRKLYKIPLATYANVDGLSVLGDNALKASAKSGEMRIVNAGSNGTGEIASGNIEGSNVEQAEQLTKLITNKQFYNMNTKSWQTGNAIIDYLLNATN